MHYKYLHLSDEQLIQQFYYECQYKEINYQNTSSILATYICRSPTASDRKIAKAFRTTKSTIDRHLEPLKTTEDWRGHLLKNQLRSIHANTDNLISIDLSVQKSNDTVVMTKFDLHGVASPRELQECYEFIIAECQKRMSEIQSIQLPAEVEMVAWL